jgi:hypothetical protein
MEIRIPLCAVALVVLIASSSFEDAARVAASEQSEAEMAERAKAFMRIIARIAMASPWSMQAASLTTYGNSPITTSRASCVRSPKAGTAACRNGEIRRDLGVCHDRRRALRAGLLLIAAALFVFAPAPSRAEDENKSAQLRICLNEELPPFSVRNKRGGAGFDVLAAHKRLGRPLKGTAPNVDESACQMMAALAAFIALGSTNFGHIRA